MTTPRHGFDLVIMNPPFTDNVKRASKLDGDTRRRMQCREMYIHDTIKKADSQAAAVIDYNSIGTFFRLLADNLVAADGYIAELKPIIALTDTISVPDRLFKASRNQLQSVVAAHDPQQPALTEGSSMNECLQVLRKNKNGTTDKTLFHSITKAPATASEGFAMAADIMRQDATGDASRVRDGDWKECLWVDASLCAAARSLDNHPDTKSINTVGPGGQRIADAFVGPSGRAICGAFEKTDDGYPAFWTISNEIRNTMGAVPDSTISIKKGMKSAAEKYLSMRSRLLIASTIDTHAGRVASIYSNQPSFGSSFVPVAIHDEDTAKAVCGYLNSTAGIICFLNRRSRKLNFPKFSLAGLRSIPIPDASRVDLSPLTAAYDRVCNAEMMRFKHAPDDAARNILDDAVSSVLDIDRQTIRDWCIRMSREPSVCGKEYTKETDNADD